MASTTKSKLNEEGQEFKNVMALALEGHQRAIALLSEPNFKRRMNNWQHRKNAENNLSRTRKSPTRKNLNMEEEEFTKVADLAAKGHERAIALLKDPEFKKRMNNWQKRKEQIQSPEPVKAPAKPLATVLLSALPLTSALVDSSKRGLEQLKRARAQLAHLGRQPVDAELAAELKKVIRVNSMTMKQQTKRGGRRPM